MIPTMILKNGRGGFTLLVRTRRTRRVGAFDFATLEEARRVMRLFERISGVRYLSAR